MQKFYPLKYDRVFKTILLDNHDYKFLAIALSDILEKEVKIESLEYVELPVINTQVKVQILDVLVKTNNKEYINVEVNINFDKVIKERNLVYYMTEYCQRYKRGGEVREKVIQVNLNFNKRSSSELKEEIRIYNTTKKEIYYEDFHIINVNIPKYKEKWYDKVIKGDKEHISLVALGIEDKVELKEIQNKCGDKVIKEVCEKVFELNADGTRRRLISVEEEQEMLIKKKLWNANNEGMEKGIKKGLKEGKKEGQEEIAYKMLKDNMSFEDILKYTSLTKEEIEKLASKS